LAQSTKLSVSKFMLITTQPFLDCNRRVSGI
jgi:hypothetical protein